MLNSRSRVLPCFAAAISSPFANMQPSFRQPARRPQGVVPRVALLIVLSQSARAMSGYDSARDRMLRETQQGAGDCSAGDASAKTILVRGCDPVMAARSKEFLPKMLGNANIVTTTDDAAFLAALKEQQFEVVFFAPGACRFNAAKQPIPGGIAATRGWSLEEYRAAVRELQLTYQLTNDNTRGVSLEEYRAAVRELEGNDITIVETLNEPEIVPLLRKALKLP